MIILTDVKSIGKFFLSQYFFLSYQYEFSSIFRNESPTFGKSYSNGSFFNEKFDAAEIKISLY